MAVVVFGTLGTWGDLFPFVGLAAELQRRGHHVRVAASPAWEATVPAAIEFAAIGRRVSFDEFAAHPEIFQRMPFGLRAAMRRFVLDQAKELTADLRESLRDADLLVAHPAHLVALNLAEQLGVRRAVASVFPGMIPSAYTVPGGSLIGPWQGRAGRAANRLSWRTGMLGAAMAFDRPINAHRRSLELRPVPAAMLCLPLSAGALVVMASPHVIWPPPDWPDQVKVTSFVPWDQVDNNGVSARTEAFLSAAEPPVLVTLGASSGMHPEDFFEQTVAAVLHAGGGGSS